MDTSKGGTQFFQNAADPGGGSNQKSQKTPKLQQTGILVLMNVDVNLRELKKGVEEKRNGIRSGKIGLAFPSRQKNVSGLHESPGGGKKSRKPLHASNPESETSQKRTSRRG